MSSELDRTQLMLRPTWDNPRVHLLDDVWLMTIVAVVLATAVPWLVSGFEIDIAGATWGLLALAAVHVGFTMLAAPRWLPVRWRARALTFLATLGVALIAFIWLHVGAQQNPLFLMTFVLPVLGSIFLSRWHPYLLAAVGSIAVCVVALERAPELRWYASSLLGSDAWLSWLPGRPGAAPIPAFPGFYAPTRYLVILLEIFMILLFAFAVAAEYVGNLFERLNANILQARGEAERGQELWTRLIERLPVPALLVDPDTARIVAASEIALAYLRAATLEGQSLFEAVRFSYPDIIQELIAGSDAEVPLTALHVADQLRLAQVRALHVAHKGRRLALLTIEDKTETFCVKAALDTSEYAAVVVDSRSRILALNRPAAGLFPGSEIGMQAARMLPHPHAGLPWWEPGLTGRRKMHIEIGPRLYQVTSSAVVVAGEDERVFAVAFLPVARAETDDPFGTGSSVILGRSR